MNFHFYFHLDPETLGLLRAINRKLDFGISKQETMMTALTDLQSAIADLKTQLDANNAAIDGLLTTITAPGTSDADVEAAVTQIRSIITANQAELAKVTPPASPAAPAA